jgi:hypothetical protein
MTLKLDQQEIIYKQRLKDADAKLEAAKKKREENDYVKPDQEIYSCIGKD